MKSRYQGGCFMEFTKDKLKVEIFDTRDETGRSAAKDIADCIRKLQSEKDEINMIFAAAPSQNETLYYLCLEEGIDWGRINAFHMDEYLDLSKDAPQCFCNYLKEHIFSKKHFKSVNYINSDAKDPYEECRRYSELLKKYPCDIVCMGIGENGHIAFNDPINADFSDRETVKVVELDEICRMQQVNDGCFEKIDDVPKKALTVTVPHLMSAKYKFCTVPGKTKANAVKRTVYDEINELCPATVMRISENSVMYCDKDSSSLLSYNK